MKMTRYYRDSMGKARSNSNTETHIAIFASKIERVCVLLIPLAQKSEDISMSSITHLSCRLRASTLDSHPHSWVLFSTHDVGLGRNLLLRCNQMHLALTDDARHRHSHFPRYQIAGLRSCDPIGSMLPSPALHQNNERRHPI